MTTGTPARVTDGLNRRALLAALREAYPTAAYSTAENWVRRLAIKTPGGYFDLEKTLARVASQDPRGNKRPPRFSEVDNFVESDSDLSPDDDVDIDEARRRKECQLAIKLRQENDEREGRLIDDAKATRAWQTAIREIRDRILAVPDRIAAILAAESDIATVRALLDASLREAMTAALDEPPEVKA